MRRTVQDDASNRDARQRFYTVEKLGPKRSLTPEGFLLCEEVPIARCGEMLYGPGETDVPVGKDGMVRIMREPEEVFTDKHILSYNGKPVVNDHPPENVSVGNWKVYACGVVLNPRRGTGSMLDDCIVADLLITDAAAIRDVEDGKVEVSCGYTADYEYEEGSRGTGRQTNLLGNHVALVDQGRCGPRCAIGDQLTCEGATEMYTKDAGVTLDSLKAAVRTARLAKDEKALDAALNALDAYVPPTAGVLVRDEGMALHIHTAAPAQMVGADPTPATNNHQDEAADPDKPRQMSDADIGSRFENMEKKMEDSFKSFKDSIEEIAKHVGMKGAADSEAEKELEGELKEEAPKGTNDAAFKNVTDSALLADSFQETAAGAEILVPGIRLPKFQVQDSAKVTFDAVCKVRRNALDLAYVTPEGRALIEDANSGPLTLDTMDCAATRKLFKTVVAAKRAVNNSARDAGQPALHRAGGGTGTRMTAAMLNEANRKRYCGASA